MKKKNDEEVKKLAKYDKMIRWYYQTHRDIMGDKK